MKLDASVHLWNAMVDQYMVYVKGERLYDSGADIQLIYIQFVSDISEIGFRTRAMAQLDKLWWGLKKDTAG